jgi:hypothetical protein
LVFDLEQLPLKNNLLSDNQFFFRSTVAKVVILERAEILRTRGIHSLRLSPEVWAVRQDRGAYR